MLNRGSAAPPTSLRSGNNPRGVRITPPVIKTRAPAVKSPVRPGTPGYGVLATPVVPRGQLNLRSQPTAPVAHQSGPRSTPETHTTTGRERPGTASDTVIIKAQHGQRITPADRARADAAARLLKAKVKLNTPKGDQSLGGGFGLGTIFPGALAHDIGGPVLSGLKDAGGAALHVAEGVPHFGQKLLQGGEALGLAGFHDVTHPRALLGDSLTGAAALGHLEGLNFGNHFFDSSHSELAQMAEKMSHSDPALALALHGPSQAASVAIHNPVNTGLDLLGGEGIVGKTLGAASDAARAGSLSRDAMLAARAGRLERAPKVLIEATKRSPAVVQERTLSPDIFKAAIQRGVDSGKLPDLNAAAGRLVREQAPWAGHLVPAAWRNAPEELATRATEDHAMLKAVETRTAQRAHKLATSGEQPLQGEQLKKFVAEAKNNQTAHHMDNLIDEHQIGVTRGSLRSIRGDRTRLHKALGLPGNPDDHFTIVKRVAAKGEPQHSWLNRVVREGAPSEAPEFSMVPKAYSDRLTAHYTKQGNAVTGAIGTGFAKVNREFRNTTLAFHPVRWMTGNSTEGALRGALIGATPADSLKVRSVLAHMENTGHASEADVLRGHSLGGLQYGMNERLSKEIDEAKAAAQGAGGPSKLGKAVNTYHKVPEAVFDFNRRTEQGIESMALGKYMRQHMHDIGQSASTENVAREFARPEVARAAGRFVRNAMGKYDAFDPGSEAFIRNFAPFSPWAKNAAKFIYKDMPTRHPLVTSALLASNSATGANWAKAHKIGMPKGVDPFDALNTDIKTGKNKFSDLGRYFPFGVGTNNPIDAALNYLVPAAQGPYRAYLGEDPFGGSLSLPGPANRLTPTGRISKSQVHYERPMDSSAKRSMLSALISEVAGPADEAHSIFVNRGATPYSGEPIWNLKAPVKPVSASKQRSILKGLLRSNMPGYPTDTTSSAKKKAVGRTTSIFSGGASGGLFK